MSPCSRDSLVTLLYTVLVAEIFEGLIFKNFKSCQAFLKIFFRNQ